ncbi:MAG: S41 family peptidase [Clostridia bacterium]|nr:S41 family peptidase [Clostridia bacterium]
MKTTFLVAVQLLFIFIYSFSQKSFNREEYLKATSNDKTVFTQERLYKFVDIIKKYHPYNSDSINGEPIKAIIKNLDWPKKPLNDAELVFHIRKFLDYMTEEDPHIVAIPTLRKTKDYKVKLSMLKTPPFWGLHVNDTLIIHKSLNKKLKQGDRILTINSIPVSEVIKYNYKYRYVNMANMMWYYHYNISDTYEIVLQRNNKDIKVDVEGIPFSEYYANNGLFCESKIYNEHRVGYFNLRTFETNRYIFKKLNSFCKTLSKEGIQNLVIDLRENTGGSGHMLDAFFSLFCSYDSIPYLKSAFVRVSKVTEDYGFSSSETGKLLPLPKREIHNTVILNSKYYVGPIKLFVLISENTASTAATFANVIQYNNMGKLVGEPLKKNALKYGEIDQWNFGYLNLTLSTVEFNEYTKAKSGVLIPDIEIPYIAKDYMQGGDPVLEKLLDKIKKNQR